jgi:hypothetical protein
MVRPTRLTLYADSRRSDEPDRVPVDVRLHS